MSGRVCGKTVQQGCVEPRAGTGKLVVSVAGDGKKRSVPNVVDYHGGGWVLQPVQAVQAVQVEPGLTHY